MVRNSPSFFVNANATSRYWRMLAAVKEGIPLALAADECGGWGRDG
ncbi:MAG: hypothetical protein ACKVJG_16165 [Candidatus Latescibacterota bacterium]|jgi:hypothetical protein